MAHPAFLTVREAVEGFGISKRTLERRLGDGTIHQSQIRREGAERQISLAELIRVFGEPKRRLKRPEAPAVVTSAAIDDTTTRLIDRLEADIARERERADREAARADQERSRAERYELELAEQRRANADMVQRLLSPPPVPAKPGFLARLFGR